MDLEFDDLLPEDQAQLLVMRSNALRLMKQWDRAISEENAARTLCLSLQNSAMLGELLFYKAAMLLLANDYDAVDSVVFEVDEIDGEANSGYDAESYPFALGHWRARIYDISGVAASLRGDHETQLSRVAAALKIAQESGVKDDFVELCMLGNYADAGRVSGSKSFVRFSSSMLDKFHPSPDLLHHLSTAYFNLAECASNEGEQGEALKLLRLATDIAPESVQQLRALLARVDLLQESGEELGSRDLLDQAILLNSTINWDAETSSPKIRLLLYLASRIANFNSVQANELLDMYYSLGHRDLKMSWISIDPGESAEEQVALARIAMSRGEVSKSLVYFAAGLEKYKTIGYTAKIAAVSFEIGKLTFDRKAFEAARLWSTSHPRSLLARKFSEFDDAVIFGQPS